MQEVIHVLMHSTYNRSIVDQNIRDGWHTSLARAVDEYTDYEVESWTIDFDVDEPYIERHHGITCRVFPSILLPGTRNDVARQVIGSAKNGEDFSWSLLYGLKKRLKEGAAAHLHGDIYLNTYLASLLPGRKFLHHHGGLHGVPLLERYAFRTLEHVFVLTDYKRQYYADTVGLDEVSVQPMGVDYDKYAPTTVDKDALGIDADGLLMYTGAFSSYKGLDVVVDVAEKLRSDYDIELVLFGGDESDPMYETLNQKSYITAYTDYVPQKQYLRYLNASDMYISFPTEKSLKAGDCGLIAPAEAMACNTPVVSSVTSVYAKELRDRLPFVPQTPTSLEDAARVLLEGKTETFSWRDASRSYFAWESVAWTIGNVYDQCLSDRE